MAAPSESLGEGGYQSSPYVYVTETEMGHAESQESIFGLAASVEGGASFNRTGSDPALANGKQAHENRIPYPFSWLGPFIHARLH